MESFAQNSCHTLRNSPSRAMNTPDDVALVLQLLSLPTTPAQITLPKYQKMPVSAAQRKERGSRQRLNP